MLQRCNLGSASDFSKIGPILDGSVEDNVADFRSLTYSLADEEAAKKASGGRSHAPRHRPHQGGLRYMSLDVKQLYGVAQLQTLAMAAETVEVSVAGAGGGGSLGAYKRAAAPLPPATTQKIAGNATVQCAFQIQ